MTKCWKGKKREERWQSTSLYSLSTLSLLSLHSHLWRYCTSRQRRRSILFSPPIRIIIMTVPTPIFEICHIYDFLEVSTKKQALRHHRQVLDGLPAYKNDLSIRTCISWIAINSTTTIIQVFSFSTRKSEIQCRNNKRSEGRTRIYCVSGTHAGERDLFHVFKI